MFCPAPKRRFFLRYWVCGIQFSIANRNLSLQVMLYDPLYWRTTEELYQSVRQFSGYFTTELYFYKYHVQWSVSVSFKRKCILTTFKFIYLLVVNFYYTKRGSSISLIWLQNCHSSQLPRSLFPFFSETLSTSLHKKNFSPLTNWRK